MFGQLRGALLRQQPCGMTTVRTTIVAQACATSSAPWSSARSAHTYSRQGRGLYGGTQKQFGSSISESHKKSARTWMPNVHTHSVFSRTLQRTLTLRMTASVWRTINNERYGGDIDKYLTSESKEIQRSLSAGRAENLRNEVRNKILRQARSKSIPRSLRKTRAVESASTPVAANTVSEGEASRAVMEGVASGM